MIRAGAPEKAAWGIALGLTVTLVWLYLEILRLLSYFQQRLDFPSMEHGTEVPAFLRLSASTLRSGACYSHFRAVDAESTPRQLAPFDSLRAWPMAERPFVGSEAFAARQSHAVRAARAATGE